VRDGDSQPEHFLDALGSEERAAIRSAGTVRTYPRGTAIFHEQQVPDSVVVLLSGHVKLTRATEAGRDALLAIRGPGDLLGELSAIDGDPRSATAIALEPTEALVVPASSFVGVMERHPSVSLLLVRMLGRRLRDADRKRVEFAAQDSVGRVASRLAELCERFGEPADPGIHIDLPLSQEELAGWAACSREAMSKALGSLRQLGLVETGRRRITVLDVEAVRRRSST
jgi:CRP/FNR family transcriptional regulator, cyclic AMP receptor protein